MRRGQVALYLVMVLVAIAVMMFANVNMFLAVRAKNRMMNAVDEAAIAAVLSSPEPSVQGSPKTAARRCSTFTPVLSY